MSRGVGVEEGCSDDCLSIGCAVVASLDGASDDWHLSTWWCALNGVGHFFLMVFSLKLGQYLAASGSPGLARVANYIKNKVPSLFATNNMKSIKYHVLV